jgi:SAM-dependent methyltransferase
MKDHERANRELWNRQSDEYQAGHGVPISAAPDAWGSWRIPESELQLLPPVRSLDVLELGCGGGQWTGWLAEQGARVTGIDISEKQLEHARSLIDRKGLRARLVPGSAESLPFEAGSFDLIISDHGAMSWADPARTVPEAARVLRPGGQLIFCATSVLMTIVAWDEDSGPADRLERDYFDLNAVIESDQGAVTFSRPHGEWIRLFRENGLAVEALVEPRPGPQAVSTFYPAPTVEWARRWPAEMIWVVRREG